MDLKPGMILRDRCGVSDLWRVMRLTRKSAALARCDGKGNVGHLTPEWMFRQTTVQRDFFPA